MEINKLLSITSAETGFTINELESRSRNKDLVFGRMIFCYLARKSGYSYPSIAKVINRDHTSVMHLYKKAENIDKIKNLLEKYNTVGKEISVGGFSKDNQRKYGHIYERFEGKCVVCGFDEVVEIHHIKPRSLGGGDEPSNVILLCPNHHALVDRGLMQIKDIHIKTLI